MQRVIRQLKYDFVWFLMIKRNWLIRRHHQVIANSEIKLKTEQTNRSNFFLRISYLHFDRTAYKKVFFFWFLYKVSDHSFSRFSTFFNVVSYLNFIFLHRLRWTFDFNLKWFSSFGIYQSFSIITSSFSACSKLPKACLITYPQQNVHLQIKYI